MLLGFTVFREEIEDGTKEQTIRLLRRGRAREPHIPKPGEPLYLYWHLRQKDCKLMGVFPCTEVLIKCWGAMKDDADLARRDGFDSLDAYRRFFADHYDLNDYTQFMIIRWNFVSFRLKLTKGRK